MSNRQCKVTRESLRNQFGKKYVRDNKKKMPSLNQLINSFVAAHHLYMKNRIDYGGVGGRRATLVDIFQMEEAVSMLRDATRAAFGAGWDAQMDRAAPIDPKVLQQEPEHAVVKAALYLFTMGGEILSDLLNRACREQDVQLQKAVGPFAAVLGEITRSAEAKRTDYRPARGSSPAPGSMPVQEDFTAYCGLCLTEKEIEGVRGILQDMETCREAVEGGPGEEGAGSSGKPKASIKGKE